MTTESRDKVVIEIEEKDDTIQLSLKGVEALKRFKEKVGAMGFCAPIHSFCCEPRPEKTESK